jgi:hypothetical protein
LLCGTNAELPQSPMFAVGSVLGIEVRTYMSNAPSHCAHSDIAHVQWRVGTIARCLNALPKAGYSLVTYAVYLTQ